MVIGTKQSNSLLLSCANVMDRSFIWSALGRMSKQGLLPIPIEDISASLTSAMNNNVSIMLFYYWPISVRAVRDINLSSLYCTHKIWVQYKTECIYNNSFQIKSVKCNTLIPSSGTYLCFVAPVSTANWTTRRSTPVWCLLTWTPMCTCRPACVFGTIFRIWCCCRRLWRWTRCHLFLYCSCTRTSPDSVTEKKHVWNNHSIIIYKRRRGCSFNQVMTHTVDRVTRR